MDRDLGALVPGRIIGETVSENELDIAGQQDWLARMKLDFTTWPDGESRREFSASANDLHLQTDTCTFDSPVAILATVQKAESQVIVAGSAKTTAQATCVRCLDQFPVPVDEGFRALVRIVPPSEAMSDTDDDEFFLLSELEPVWDLAEVVRQVILLGVPENPLCREDCAGLCPRCGRNLNREKCVCRQEANDSPFATLAEMLEESKKRRR
jgi:uncharacterized protein